MNIGLQLYTVRDQLNLGYDEILKRVSEAGYTGIEIGYSPESADELGRLIKKYSLKVTSVGAGADDIENAYDKVKEFMKQMDSDIMIVGFGESDLDTVEKAMQVAARLDKLAKKIGADAYTLACHNHWWEFTERFDGKTVTDIFCENSEVFKFEIDIGWASYAGADVVKYINKLGGRIALLHIKDVTVDKKLTEVGSGTVDMKKILGAASSAGVKWGIVEQDDNFRHSSFESIKASYDYLKSIL